MSEIKSPGEPFEPEPTKNETFGSETPVTGQTKMQAAWSSDVENAESTAQVASMPTGQIFQQIYQPWNGTLNPRWMRNWAILRHHVLGIVSKGHRPWNVPTKLFIFFVVIASMTDAAMALLFGMIGDTTLYDIWGVNRDNMYGHVMGFFPRNILWYPIIAALLVGGMISEDRANGTSAMYFSRPINRFDYAAMKFLSVGLILFFVINGTLAVYYFVDILVMGKGWSWIIDTFPMFMATFLCGIILSFTYTSIGLALSSVSRGRFFPAIGLIAILMGTKSMAAIIDGLFDKSVLYVISPYDAVAHVCQALIGTEMTYDHPWVWSLISVVVMNGLALYLLANRVSSLEVTRE
ncbi:MAG: ABC transporter permease subunit [Euryarchaeota archaeon]|jgi:ABC-type transport system involved in multi-copper enzyme maturation permease subunit|nr:ABC transporter permease subunit [Euryarchaeota archaeon]MBT4982573.1 ABC transporter permease subunit [Euryarchaeota archaeon]MBT5184264.1 ABC transporter permease subunit [Euryarchaeota archaeon]